MRFAEKLAFTFGCILAASAEEIAVKPAAPPAHTNRLLHETSPYLLQHAHNPVDWYPWGEEAIARARTEDKPIFLSIGYAACHWCHVMAHESFEDEAIAALMNKYFICIKVDREERPDLDEIYMHAVVALTGSGGWPMSVFLTPDLRPFYGGTYYPPGDMYGRPGFPTILRSIGEAWNSRRDALLESAEALTAHLRNQLTGATLRQGEVSADVIDHAAESLKRRFDAKHGGWGDAPKFPSTGAILVLLRCYQRTQDEALLGMATRTLDAMACGGMYDQLGGGFHRYSVDAEWLVPHFEKMLYDNAQLAHAYLEAYQATRNPFYARIARETLDYVLRDMRDAGGGFHSTEDADSEGEEGKFYLWKEAEVLEALGAEDGELFCAYYGVRRNGNFSSHEDYHLGLNILHVPVPPAEFAAARGMTTETLEMRLAPLRARMLELRARRVRPGRDDKVLTAWNALMISALCKGAQALDEARYAQAAVEAGRFLMRAMLREGGLLRTHRQGESRLPAYLDDYAFTLNALIDLYETTFDLAWLEAAERLAEEMNRRFWDADAGCFYYTGAEHAHLIVRTKPSYDGAEPSGNSMAALALLRLGKLLDRQVLTRQAESILRAAYEPMARVPEGYLRMICAADFLLFAPREIALIGPRDAAPTQAFIRALHALFVPNKVLAHMDPKSAEAPTFAARIPLLAGKTLVEGAPAAYVCRDFMCKLPATTPQALQEQLR
jgi:uncharacterized protein YyaL (SSP411 family)